MSFTDALLLIGTGIIAGCINTLAGGGSLLTMPLLIFLGLPSAEANASNRVSLFIQNFIAVRGFKSKGVAVFPFAYWVGISASIGSIVGTLIAVDISDQLFNRILAVVMIAVMIATVFKLGKVKEGGVEQFGQKRTVKSVILFFFIGIYGGFIQAGIGFIVIATLSMMHALSLAKTNSIKVFVGFSYTTVALAIFFLNGMVRLDYGLVLALGSATGAWFTSRWSVSIPDKFVRGFLLVTVTALAVKLWFF